MRYKAPVEQKRQVMIMSMYRAGKSRAEISRALGVPPQTVAYIVGGACLKAGGNE